MASAINHGIVEGVARDGSCLAVTSTHTTTTTLWYVIQGHEDDLVI